MVHLPKKIWDVRKKLIRSQEPCWDIDYICFYTSMCKNIIYILTKVLRALEKVRKVETWPNLLLGWQSIFNPPLGHITLASPSAQVVCSELTTTSFVWTHKFHFERKGVTFIHKLWINVRLLFENQLYIICTRGTGNPLPGHLQSIRILHHHFGVTSFRLLTANVGGNWSNDLL